MGAVKKKFLCFKHVLKSKYFFKPGFYKVNHYRNYWDSKKQRGVVSSKVTIVETPTIYFELVIRSEKKSYAYLRVVSKIILYLLKISVILNSIFDNYTYY